ncbi:hypothetical protein Hanom_Chr08g00745761 [Helianthus anomalus]
MSGKYILIYETNYNLLNIQKLSISPFYVAPATVPEVFDLDELDNYSTHIQVKKEPSPKATTSSKPIGSKAITTPSLLQQPRHVLPVLERGRKRTLLLPLDLSIREPRIQ